MDARRYLNGDRGRLKKNNGRRDVSVYGRREGRRRRSEARDAALQVWWRRVLMALKWLTAGIVLGGLAWSVPVLWSWLDRPVAKVEVSGAFRYLDQAQVQRTLQPYLQTTFFGLDLWGLKEQLQRDAWIDSVQVRKIWPDRVEIVLEEETPVARWQGDKLINAEGGILQSRNGRSFDDLPALGGPVGREREVMQQYLTLSQQLRPLGLKVAGLQLASSGSWRFQIGGVDVQLGGEQLIGRMQRFSRLYFSQLKSQWGRVKSIDLRYRDGIAVAWTEALIP